MTKEEIKKEIERLKTFGFNTFKVYDKERFVEVVNRLEHQRCNTPLAIKIAEYEQRVGMLARQAKTEYREQWDLDFEDAWTDFTIEGVHGSEVDMRIVTIEGLAKCNIHLECAYEKFAVALEEAYECLSPLLEDEDDADYFQEDEEMVVLYSPSEEVIIH